MLANDQHFCARLPNKAGFIEGVGCACHWRLLAVFVEVFVDFEHRGKVHYFDVAAALPLLWSAVFRFADCLRVEAGAAFGANEGVRAYRAGLLRACERRLVVAHFLSTLKLC